MKGTGALSWDLVEVEGRLLVETGKPVPGECAPASGVGGLGRLGTEGNDAI